MGLTGSFMLLELVVGHLTNSTLLVADSFHMLCDLLAAGVALVCIRYKVYKVRYKPHPTLVPLAR